MRSIVCHDVTTQRLEQSVEALQPSPHPSSPFLAQPFPYNCPTLSCPALHCPVLSEDVFLLDTYTQVFLWIGEGSTEEEKGKGLIFANKFIKEVHTYIHTLMNAYLPTYHS